VVVAEGALNGVGRIVEVVPGDLLIDYDAEHGTALVLTLSEYFDRGGNYDASAKALLLYRSTLKYRLQRIRRVSGYDLGLPDVQVNIQVARTPGGSCRHCANHNLDALAVLPG
jgi:DNA-binding PucR family transcriptional regulator